LHQFLSKFGGWLFWNSFPSYTEPLFII